MPPGSLTLWVFIQLICVALRPKFVATICRLTELVMGPELGHVLRVVYAKEGVR